MKNIPTQVVRNGDFYPRNQIIDKIYRRLRQFVKNNWSGFIIYVR